jgi:hypothetical protein
MTSYLRILAPINMFHADWVAVRSALWLRINEHFEPVTSNVTELRLPVDGSVRELEFRFSLDLDEYPEFLLDVRATLESHGISPVDEYGRYIADVVFTTLPVVPVPQFQGPFVGLDCPVAQVSTQISQFQNINYMRDFGIKVGAIDGADLPGPDGLRVQAAHAAGIMLHFSNKVRDDAKFITFLDELHWMVDPEIGCMYSPHHEPVGNITGAAYRAWGEFCAGAISTHPNGHLVRWNGPLLTAFNIAQNELDKYAYQGMNAIFGDRYAGVFADAPGYPSGAEMFGPIVQAAAEFDLPWGVPELGAEVGGMGRTAATRAQAIATWGAYLLAQPTFLCVGWWQRGGTLVLPGTPEFTALQDFLNAGEAAASGN